MKTSVLVSICLARASAAAVLSAGAPVFASAQGSTYFELFSAWPVNAAEPVGRLDQVYVDVVERLGVSLDEKIALMVFPPRTGLCRSRGWTMVGQQGGFLPPVSITVFADETTSEEQALAVLAHEVGHVIQQQVLDEDHSIQSIFNEGFATWAAGAYWLEWQGASSFESAVRSYIAAGAYLPLHENDGFLDTLSEDAVSRFGEDCLSRRDIIYTEWAAFIEYLVEEHGRERLYSLYEVPPLLSDDQAGRFLKPDFPAVYGSSLEQLEAAWLQSISAD